MDIFAAAERAMRMDDETWARHASRASVYSRIAILPLLALAIWARVWIGWWALLPIAALIAFAWVNPRLFPAEPSTDYWAARATFGERVWLNRQAVPVPTHHARWANGLTIAAFLGILPLAWGLWALDPGWTVTGLVLAMGAKLWFCDRMVWLYRDMIDADPAYRSWLR
ncbi:hypothetical protein HKCCE3408_04005 [Rhodobacterales bacterium HKCCE3408]|nr:hypothetical protein [Rhodobacterales bacterium HKCCE3408]